MQKPKHMAISRLKDERKGYRPRHMREDVRTITFGAGVTAGNTQRVYRDEPIPSKRA